MSDFNNDQLQADNAQYAALAAELAEPDPELAHLSSGSVSDEPAPQADERGGEQRPQDEDTDRQQRIAAAAAQADQGQDQLEARRLESAPPPSMQDDPLAYVQHLGAQVQSVVAQNQQRQLVQVVQASEEQMRQSTPDYDDALRHLEGKRMAELEVMYPDDDSQAFVIARQYLGAEATPAHLRLAMIRQEAGQVIQHAMSRGQSPAKLAYDIAVQKATGAARRPSTTPAAVSAPPATTPDRSQGAGA